jgi:cytidylate kinase
MPDSDSRSIVVSGDLGSGKSAISAALSTRLNRRMISVGGLYREMAQERGMSALQINLHAERDETIDDRVDQMQAKIASSEDELIVDSRLGWYFFKNAFKVHVIVDPVVGATRVMSRPGSSVETYGSIGQAISDLRSRSDSERARYLKKYHADKARLKNYDMICDTTRASLSETVECITAAYCGSFGLSITASDPPLLLLDPARLYPSHGIDGCRDLWDDNSSFVAEVGVIGFEALEPLAIGYDDEHYFVVDGHRRLSSALLNDFTLVTGRLVAQGDEPVVAGISARDYFVREVGLTDLHDWESAHHMELPLPAHLQPLVTSAR